MDKYKSNRIISLYLLLLVFIGMFFVVNINTKAKSYYSNDNVRIDNRYNQNNDHDQNIHQGYWHCWHHKGYVNLRSRMNYVSQLRPRYIPGACEVASLKMALSIKGKARHVPLHRIVNRIGWKRHGNPNYEYSNNPYQRNAGTIYPRELVRVAKWYGARAKIADHSSKRKLIHYLHKRDPIVIEVGHKMRMNSDHIVCLIGYRRARHGKLSEFEYADPENFSHKPLIRWANTNWVMKVYDRPVTGQRAVIIL